MSFDRSTVPMPKTAADYAACYRANVVEARSKLEDARRRWRQFKDAGQITERVEGGWKFEGPTAAQVHGDLVRWQSDLAHWATRLAEAEREAQREAKVIPIDRRLPPEPDDDHVPF